MPTFDVVINGGGIVGLFFANLLAEQTTLTIAVIEKHRLPIISSNEYDVRVSALSLVSKRMLEKLHIWETIPPQRISAYREMIVWDAIGGGEIQFSHQEVAQPCLGYILENNIIINALFDYLQNFTSVKIFQDSTIREINFDKNQVELQLADETVINTQLLVGADGINSQVRKEAKIKVREWSYHQYAVVANVSLEKPHHDTAWQVFLPTGPLALLPLSDSHQVSIVWSTTPKQADRLMFAEPDDFNSHLKKALNGKMGNVKKISKVGSFPLFMRHAREYVKSNLALIGDAAHSIHPLAGQGVNLGMLDAASLAEVIEKGLNNYQSLGKFSLLRAYERWRRGENWFMIGAMEIFKHLFSNDNQYCAKIRSLGLNQTNRQRWLKTFFMRRAMGLQGDLPFFARNKVK